MKNILFRVKKNLKSSFIILIGLIATNVVCGQTQSGCTIAFPNNFDNQVNLSSIYNSGSCPSGDLILDNLNDKNGNSTVTFDTNITLNSLTLNYKSGNNPLEIIIPNGVTVTVVDFVDMNLSSVVQDKFLSVSGVLNVGGNIDFGNIDLEIDGNGGTISAGSITGAGNTSCGADTDCPTFDVPGGCAPASSGLCSESALPIELLSFGVYESNGMMLVNWATASEINNDYFTIERSSDGLNYQSIATVAGAGNSSEELEYSYVDRNPLFGRSYYRLKQTDFDGASETFAPVAMDFTSLSNGDITLTNPVRSGEEVTVYANTDETENLKLTIFNMVGEKIIDQNFSGVSYSFQLDADVRPGIYFVRISSVNSEKTGRLLIQ
ncbi:MAG: T9SS type A sorting domain-containing protein [Fulvivirga sp.]|uniref:T9SS type A sorting domain-containing protein n=1 Tax=Fulvivirga sp. TaxID=1931237 RepID=UPI0032ED5708